VDNAFEVFFGLAPTLMAWVIDFATKIDLEDAAHGPRFMDG
jgi:hypothetical protein